MTTARFGRGDVGRTTASGVEVLLVPHPIVCRISSKKNYIRVSRWRHHIPYDHGY